MTWGLLGLCILLAGLAAYAMHAALTGKDGQLADREKRLESDERADHALSERDLAVVQLAAERTKSSDLMKAKAIVEAERNELAREVADLKAKALAKMPVSDEGAAIGNDEFAKPPLSESSTDGLEKP